MLITLKSDQEFCLDGLIIENNLCKGAHAASKAKLDRLRRKHVVVRHLHFIRFLRPLAHCVLTADSMTEEAAATPAPAPEPPAKPKASMYPPDKIELMEEFEQFKDHIFLPKHPNVTGETDKCWACGSKADPEKCVFKERIKWRNPTDEEQKNEVKTCIFLTNECWLGGWPLVRHHFVLAGPTEEEIAAYVRPGDKAD